MPNTIVLYSTNTWLAFNVAERYFRGEHYVWCTPHFASGSLSSLAYTVPPTSSPLEIYRRLYGEVVSRDRHSPKIAETKIGLLKGAGFKRKAGIINEEQENDIKLVVEAAEIGDFRPLLYVIPYAGVTKILKPVPINERANPLSEEYRIENLPRHCFDVIEFSWS